MEVLSPEPERLPPAATTALPACSVVLAAHPDDETVGAGGLLCMGRGCRVLHLTSGAPSNRSLWPPGLKVTRQEYAQLRRAEAEAALAFVEIPPDRIHLLGGEDQSAILEAVSLTLRTAGLLARFRPPMVVTHAYEGGHPDHDTAALVAHAALALLEREGSPVPKLVEMTSYHARDGAFVAGEFLHENATTSTVRVLSEAELDRKQRMFEAYRSQTAVLSEFPLESERFRNALRYRFDQPPHPGKLWYELQGWMLGGEWRAWARAALLRLELGADAWL